MSDTPSAKRRRIESRMLRSEAVDDGRGVESVVVSIGSVTPSDGLDPVADNELSPEFFGRQVSGRQSGVRTSVVAWTMANLIAL